MDNDDGGPRTANDYSLGIVCTAKSKSMTVKDFISACWRLDVVNQ